MLPAVPLTNPAPLYRHRDSVCVADALIAAVAGLDLLTEISASSATVPEQARRPGVAERPFDVIVTLLCALGWTALPPGVAS